MTRRKNILIVFLLLFFAGCSSLNFPGWNQSTPYDKAKIAGLATNQVYDSLMTTITDEMQSIVKLDDQGKATNADKRRLRDLDKAYKVVAGYEFANKAYLIALKKWKDTGEKPLDFDFYLDGIKKYLDLFNEISQQYNIKLGGQ